MNYNEIKEVLQIDGKESKVFMPNEIFEDLQNEMKDSSHIAYAYSYMYLSHFLYRNCKYFNVQTVLDNNVLKQILGYSKSNRTMNYITKKGGLLDDMGYTESTKNYPITWEFKKESDEELEFTMYEDMKEEMPLPPKMFFLKHPVKALDERVINVVEYDENRNKVNVELELMGTFYDVEQTHSVDFEVFMFCMSKKELGVIAFYLYSWLKHKNDIFGGYDVPMTKLSDETGINRRTLIRQMDLLKGHKMIDFQHNQEFFVVGAFKEDRKATTYYTNGYPYFTQEYTPFKKMEVQPRQEYLEGKELEVESKKAEVDIDLLPF